MPDKRSPVGNVSCRIVFKQGGSECISCCIISTGYVLTKMIYISLHDFFIYTSFLN